MLDRLKLIKQITAKAVELEEQQINQIDLALALWHQIRTDLEFKTNLLTAKLDFSTPDWDGDLGQVTQVSNQKIAYTVVASDGSQIYPDRHMGSNYYLINTGLVILRYNDSSSGSFSNEPSFLTDLGGFAGNVVDYIDSKRHEFEIAAGLKAAMLESASPLIYLADGSLIAWHLFGKGEHLQDRFMPVYLQQLQEFYELKIPFVGYISLPNSTELVNLVRAKLMDFKMSEKGLNELGTVTDADFMAGFLQPWQFTNWFKSNVAAAKTYPPELKPYFAYCHTGYEIVRIEVPGWIANDQALLNFCMQVVIDQAGKGYGYPVALAEAHQQAVIKTPDRNFFYQIIHQVTKKGIGKASTSRKLKHKQIMHI